jgi:hypothetical protein
VLVDEELMGHVGNGETLDLRVEPGPHVVRLRIDWAGSRKLPLFVEDHATVEVVAQTTTATPVTALVRSILRPNAHITLSHNAL